MFIDAFDYSFIKNIFQYRHCNWNAIRLTSNDQSKKIFIELDISFFCFIFINIFNLQYIFFIIIKIFLKRLKYSNIY